MHLPFLLSATDFFCPLESIEPVGGPELAEQFAEIIQVFHGHPLILILIAGVTTDKHAVLVVLLHISLDGDARGSKSRRSGRCRSEGRGVEGKGRNRLERSLYILSAMAAGVVVAVVAAVIFALGSMFLGWQGLVRS